MADDITNSVYTQVDMSKKMDLVYGDLPTEIIHGLWQAKAEFDAMRMVARAAASTNGGTKRKRHDKSPW